MDKITGGVGPGIASLGAASIVGLAFILGGAFGHNFWPIATGSILEGSVIIVTALKVRQLFHKKQHVQQDSTKNGYYQVPANTKVSLSAQVPYIPNPSYTGGQVVVDTKILAHHVQYGPDGSDRDL